MWEYLISLVSVENIMGTFVLHYKKGFYSRLQNLNIKTRLSGHEKK